ncbi:MAG: ActS/PrrB/RegB family redox-sensitive histidine kinase, partial [Hyphomicrobiaceae bacterium]|nr:ActS/PrrB/RegB family redox-sensitive histidine kinase [Hyphomicrobiaceae bacterium]
LGGLLYLTGGAQNPFILLLLVPVVISATVLPLLMTATLGVLAIAVTTLLAFFHLPLPWYPGTQLVLPFAYIGGQWVAIVSSLVFTAVYAWRVAAEARQLSDALTATELILQREQHLSAIDGLAAAAAHELGTPLATIALVAKEMSKALEGEERFADDLALLNSQAARCRDILRRISSLDAENRDYFDRLPLSSLIEEVVAPHRDFDVEIETRIDRRDQQEPVTRRSTGVIYGLGNIVENAVDFARSKVIVDC